MCHYCYRCYRKVFSQRAFYISHRNYVRTSGFYLHHTRGATISTLTFPALWSYLVVNGSASQNGRDQQVPRSQTRLSKSSNHMLSSLTFHSFLPPSVQAYFQFFSLSFLSSDPGSHLPESSFVGWSGMLDRAEENVPGKRCEQERFQNHLIPCLSLQSWKQTNRRKTVCVSTESYLHWQGQSRGELESSTSFKEWPSQGEIHSLLQFETELSSKVNNGENSAGKIPCRRMDRLKLNKSKNTAPYKHQNEVLTSIFYRECQLT